MIRITVEMVPTGDESRAYTMAQGIIANDGTGTMETGSYIYGLTGQTNVPNRDPGIRYKGTVGNFPRKRQNVWHLLKLCLNDAL